MFSNLSRVTYLVIDEADRMLAMGFYDQLSAISSQIQPERQTLLFSATFPQRLREAANIWVGNFNAVTLRCSTIDIDTVNNNPLVKVDASSTIDNGRKAVARGDGEDEAGEEIISGGSLTITNSVTQRVHVCAAHKKPRLLIKYILKMREEEKSAKARQAGPMLIFCNKVKTIKFVHDFLSRQSVVVDVLHGQLPQSQRERTLSNFKAVGNVK